MVDRDVQPYLFRTTLLKQSQNMYCTFHLFLVSCRLSLGTHDAANVSFGFYQV